MGSTGLLSAVVIILGILIQLNLYHNTLQGEPFFFYLTGWLGMAAAVRVREAFQKRVDEVKKLADEELNAQQG